jgi:hypothetical protein
MNYWVLILIPTFLLITAADVKAHNLVTVNSNAQDHQHVYRRQQYGKPLQQGHLNKSPGGSSMIIWGAGTRSDYGTLNAGRNGPIIDDQRRKPVRMPKHSKKYGSAVKSYGKPRRDY